MDGLPRLGACPCCGHLVFDAGRGWPGSYEICPVCFWEDDGVQLRYPNMGGGANRPSLIEAQRNYAAYRACEERGRRHARPARADEPRDPSWRPIDPARDSFEDLHEVDPAPWPSDTAQQPEALSGVPPDLRDRIVRLNAELTAGSLDCGAAVRLACDLLVAGIDHPGVVELAIESTTLLRSEGEPLVRSMLSGLGVEPVDTTGTAWIQAGDIARHMVAGTLPAEKGAELLWGLWWACGSPQEIGLILQPLDTWHGTAPVERDDDGLRAEMRGLAADIARAADVRTTATEDNAHGA
ncbi:CPCC family cysteine-rich protein [Streptomyces sp. NPDC049813]|uniref:CPCC family cysteine-rich protein n=1 Tax=Streptomyces sp. NPDC049813 TaxID=3365597 RepID=UPI0037AF6386